ncbi:hypothetical protein PanWU01x14_195390 [Parasponia andersonii]|uniref:Uncharacterized protein n=1 Tax=Parasponia andersonii TaxID=3476 RepID=A0A2P5C094_PARAD|nr:hypothetical protein PanWU01x14_195390 [Parasponia andersonii]
MLTEKVENKSYTPTRVIWIPPSRGGLSIYAVKQRIWRRSEPRCVVVDKGWRGSETEPDV